MVRHLESQGAIQEHTLLEQIRPLAHGYGIIIVIFCFFVFFHKPNQLFTIKVDFKPENTHKNGFGFRHYQTREGRKKKDCSPGDGSIMVQGEQVGGLYWMAECICVSLCNCDAGGHVTDCGTHTEGL